MFCPAQKDHFRHLHPFFQPSNSTQRNRELLPGSHFTLPAGALQLSLSSCRSAADLCNIHVFWGVFYSCSAAVKAKSICSCFGPRSHKLSLVSARGLCLLKGSFSLPLSPMADSVWSFALRAVSLFDCVKCLAITLLWIGTLNIIEFNFIEPPALVRNSDSASKGVG